MNDIQVLSKKYFELDIKQSDEVTEKSIRSTINSIYNWKPIFGGCIAPELINVAIMRTIDQITGESTTQPTGAYKSAASEDVNINETDPNTLLVKLECTSGHFLFSGAVDGVSVDIMVQSGNSIEGEHSIIGKVNATVDPASYGQFSYNTYICGIASCGFAAKKLVKTDEVIEDIDPTPVPVPVEYTLTFKVVNGDWDDSTREDKTVTLSGTAADLPILQETDIPGVGTKPIEGYQQGYWDITPIPGERIGSDMEFTYYYVEIPEVTYNVTFIVKFGSWNDGTADDKIVSLTGTVQDLPVLGEDDIPEAGEYPTSGFQAGNWDIIPNAGDTIDSDKTYTYVYAIAPEPEPEPEPEGE